MLSMMGEAEGMSFKMGERGEGGAIGAERVGKNRKKRRAMLAMHMQGSMLSKLAREAPGLRGSPKQL